VSSRRRGLPTGVQRKHSRSCPAYGGGEGRCRCRGGYQAQAGSRGARATRTFRTVDEAVGWKRDMDARRAAGELARGRSPLLEDAAERWLTDARLGVALARGREPFRPSTLRDYQRVLAAEVLPVLGGVPLDRLSQERLNEFAAGLARRGLAASTVRNVVMPLRAIYRHASRMGWVRANPTLGMLVPAGSGRRMRIVTPDRIPVYLGALADRDRPVWAAAFYAGLRRGELMALRWSDVDLAGGTIRVDAEQGGYDQKTRSTHGPKSAAGARRVPVTAFLREPLLEHRDRAGARAQGLVFARGALAGHCRAGSERLPFNDSSTGQRARAAWTAAGLPAVSLHDCRHTFASLAIAAMAARGVFNPKLLQQVMGHSSIQVTYDRYGHLFPGQEAEVAVMLDELLAGGQGPASGLVDVVGRLRAELDGLDPGAARPVVAEAVQSLLSWAVEHERPGPLPSVAATVAGSGERAARVQPGPGRREP
jgi:integrase